MLSNPGTQCMFRKQITLDINAINSHAVVNHLINERCGAAPIIPDLAEEKAIKKPEAYNRFRDLDGKEKFRKKIIDKLTDAFRNLYSANEADKRIIEFKNLAENMEKNGAIIFGNMINIKNFEKLVGMYTSKLSTDGSKSWIHSYINLGNHPDFITNENFNDAFIHPLLVTLISYSAGGPIRLVDGRGKDAEPLAVQAQDNMLHIDNTPFRKEYKVILTWERGKASGPKGQNFVFIPGTHKAIRNCKVSNNGEAWSTEDGSIFTSENSVQKIFDIQEKILGKSPVVVEAAHPEMPLTTIFEAGALVHHRYRTKEKNVPRSCVIFAFHRAQDNPGQFLSQEHVDKVAEKDSLLYLLMGKHCENTEDRFINAILANVKIIADKIEDINSNNASTKIVTFSTRVLDNNELKKWKAAVTAAPTVEAIKIKQDFFQLGDSISHNLLVEMVRYDKHGPLDLILYSDGHEEIRKWARNRIREMPIKRLEDRLKKFAEWDLITDLNASDLLTPLKLKNIADELIKFMDQLSTKTKENTKLDNQEKISPIDAYRSVRQLIDDLGEAILRCSSRQTFLSTSLFLFWASDELSRLLTGHDEKPAPSLLDLSRKLFANYIATYILITKQIKQELILSKSSTSNQNSVTSLLSANLSLFKKYVDTHLEEHRHANSTLQHEYDKRYGLVPYAGTF